MLGTGYLLRAHLAPHKAMMVRPNFAGSVYPPGGPPPSAPLAGAFASCFASAAVVAASTISFRMLKWFAANASRSSSVARGP